MYKKNIICFDLSRLINSGKINKIIFNKTETLSNNEFMVSGYHPVSSSLKNKNIIQFLNYSKEQNKELNLILFNYYQTYLKSISKQKKRKYTNISLNKISEEYITLFLECLLSCNSIDNYNFELFGNDLEIKLFNDMKWKIKQYEENNNAIKIKYFKDLNVNNDETANNNYLNNQYYYVIKTIIDIFPNNYYKLTELNEN